MKRIFTVLVLLIMCLLHATGIADTVSFAGGDGSSSNPYQIATVGQLNAVRDHLNSHFILCSNMDLSSIENWTPIGSESKPFTGTFNGNGYRISNITINKSITTSDLQAGNVDIGFFGYTSGATITKLGIEEASYQVNAGNFSAEVYSQVGGIAGTIKNTTITQCYFTGDIENNGGSYVLARSGGIAAIGLSSTVSDCYVNGNISGYTSAMNVMVAGLIPWLDKTNVEKCYVAGKVTSDTKNGYSYVGGIHASGNADVFYGYVFEYCGTVKNCVVVLEELSATGASVIKNDVGYYSEMSNNKVLAHNSSEARSQATYKNLGWDFDKIWIAKSSSLPSFKYFRNLNGFYDRKDGWPILNHYKAYGYTLNDDGEYYYDDPLKFFSQGFDITSLIASILNLKYEGNCFGLSLLAVAQYNNQIDLLQYLYPNGENLNSKGYHKLIPVENVYMYSLEGNDDVVDIIERAQFSQFSLDINDAEIGSWDFGFDQVINHLSEDNPTPLVVTLDFSYGSGGGHTVVTDTTKKPEEIEDGVWKISCYDCNSPRDSLGRTDLSSYYYASEPYLCLNTKENTWYYQNDWQEDIYAYSYFTGKGIIPCTSIKFYDISKLSARFFYNDFDLFNQGEFNLFITDNITVFATQNQTLFQMQNNNPIVVGEGTIYKKFIGNAIGENISKTTAALSLPINTDPVVLSQGETRLLRYDDDHLIALHVDGDASIRFDDNTNTIIIENAGIDELSFDIAIQNQSGSQVVHAIGKLEEERYIELTTQFGGNIPTIKASTNSDEEKIETSYTNNGTEEKTDYHKQKKTIIGIVNISGQTVYGQMLTASVSNTNNTGILTYTWKRNDSIIGTGETYTLTAQDIGKSLTCEVTSSIETGSIVGATPIIAKQAGPAAPTNLTGVAPTSFTTKDGKIIGTTEEMEYALNADFSDAKSCGDGETISLIPGTYYVRIKETSTAEAGEYVIVVIPEYVRDFPVIQYPENDQTVNVEIGNTANMAVMADHAVNYQWFVDRNDGKGFVEISGATSAVYTTAAVKAENEGYRYFCRVSNADGYVDSPIFTLQVIQTVNLPDTGDHSRFMIWTLMVALSIVMITLMSRKKRIE